MGDQSSGGSRKPRATKALSPEAADRAYRRKRLAKLAKLRGERFDALGVPAEKAFADGQPRRARHAKDIADLLVIHHTRLSHFINDGEETIEEPGADTLVPGVKRMQLANRVMWCDADTYAISRATFDHWCDKEEASLKSPAELMTEFEARAGGSGELLWDKLEAAIRRDKGCWASTKPARQPVPAHVILGWFQRETATTEPLRGSPVGLPGSKRTQWNAIERSAPVILGSQDVYLNFRAPNAVADGLWGWRISVFEQVMAEPDPDRRVASIIPRYSGVEPLEFPSVINRGGDLHIGPIEPDRMHVGVEVQFLLFLHKQQLPEEFRSYFTRQVGADRARDRVEQDGDEAFSDPETGCVEAEILDRFAAWFSREQRMQRGFVYRAPYHVVLPSAPEQAASGQPHG